MKDDTISRQVAIDALKAIKIGLWEIDIPHPGNCPEYIEHHKQIQEMMGGVDNWIERIKASPTAESELIRCKDCEYGEQDDEGRWYCGDIGCSMGSDDGSGFCAEARRRSDG